MGGGGGSFASAGVLDFQAREKRPNGDIRKNFRRIKEESKKKKFREERQIF